jgi:hypothetical protein
VRPKAPLVVLCGILILTLGACGILAVESRDRSAEAARAREYQHLVGGLGFGPALDLSRCACSFDPRLCHHCPADLGPIPGGGCFCPQHACSIFYYPALDAAP